MPARIFQPEELQLVQQRLIGGVDGAQVGLALSHKAGLLQALREALGVNRSALKFVNELGQSIRQPREVSHLLKVSQTRLCTHASYGLGQEQSLKHRRRLGRRLAVFVQQT